MISIERGLEIVQSVAAQHSGLDWMGAESVPVSLAVSRILREDILADSDSPRFDKSTRDGFAVRSEDVRNAPRNLAVVAESRAGAGSGAVLGPGQCCEIMTGAPMPSGADAVIMIERTERLSLDTVRILKSVKPGDGWLRKGAEAHAGERLIGGGKRIGIADIGLLASVGKSEVQVSRKPRVGIVATGDELVEIRQTPNADQIRNSNASTLFAQCALAGADPALCGIARDDLVDLRAKIGPALDHDILLVSGGVSMGKYDLVEQVFAEFGVQPFFDKVAMKPGKPTVFGYRDGVFVFGLPGNPVSTMVAFHLFVRPVIQHLLKAAGDNPQFRTAVLEAPAKCDPERVALVPANVRFEDGRYRIAEAPWKGSSDLAGLSRANALVVIPKREGIMQPGETAEFLSLD